MKVTVHFTSQGRWVEGSLFVPESQDELSPTLLFEGSMTGATSQVMDHLAQELSQKGFICLIIDHSYYGEEESSFQPWESPTKRKEDLISALAFLAAHSSVDVERIVGVGVSVGGEFLVEVCRESPLCKGLVFVEGPFDDTQNLAQNLDIPIKVVDETHPEQAVLEIEKWVRDLFSEKGPRSDQTPRFDWTLTDK